MYFSGENACSTSNLLNCVLLLHRSFQQYFDTALLNAGTHKVAAAKVHNNLAALMSATGRSEESFYHMEKTYEYVLE